MQRLLYSFTLVFFSVITFIQAETVKIMPLGDSITWDWHYNDPRTDSQRHGYRNYLWYKLKAANYDVNFVGSRENGQAVRPVYDGDNEGYTGYTTYQIRDLVYNRLQRYSPDIILLHIGTNDSMYHTPDMAATHLDEILDKIDEYKQSYHKKITVILARIIPLPKAGDWVYNYNLALDAMAERRINDGDDLIVVNMNTIKSLIDGIHPTDSGYQQMATIWFNALKKPIEDRNNYAFLIPIYHTILNE